MGSPDFTDRDDAGAADADVDAAVRGPRRPLEGEVALELDRVSRSFGDETAVDGLSLAVREGELFTLLGPSGCGKTTTLRLLAGLDDPDDGAIYIAGEDVAGDDFVPPEERDVGLVFQDFALFPHLSVAENVAFGLDGLSGAETEARVDELLDLVDLNAQRDAAPDELSGGQRQRVALARSLAPEPEVLLLDEPFSNLDVSLRVEMREEVRRILKSAGVTAVSVTHDQEEALSISDRVAVMNEGDLEQVGRPEEVFEHPESRFVASFLGQAGFLSGTFSEGRVETPLDTFPVSMLQGLSAEYDGAEVDVLVRPDDLRATPAEGGADGESTDDDGTTGAERGDGRIVSRQYTGPAFVYGVELDDGSVVHCEHNHATDFTLDQRVRVDLVADHSLAWYPGR